MTTFSSIRCLNNALVVKVGFASVNQMVEESACKLSKFYLVLF